MAITPPLRMRLDKWLWAARFYKTRALACEAVDAGRVKVNGVQVKPARELAVNDVITLRQDAWLREVLVLGLSLQRGPAPQAQTLYQDTEQSLQARAQWQEQRRLAPEPALAIAHGRPTKRDRRDIDAQARWGDRWSAGIDR